MLRAIAALVCALAVSPTLARCQSKPASEQGAAPATVLSPQARDKLMQQARQSYYILHAHGFQEFHCQVLLDWDTMYSNIDVDTVGREQLLPMLKKMQIQIAVGPTGAVNVSHESDVAPLSDDVAARMRQSTGGIEQLLTGFFQTWSQFAIDTMFPDVGSDYQMEAIGDRYRVTQKDSSGEVVLEMNHDLVMDRMHVATSKVNGNVDPVFTPGKGGLMLTGYEGNVRSEGGPAQQLTVKVTYQDVDGFQLPHAVTALIARPSGGPINLPLTFATCHAKGK